MAQYQSVILKISDTVFEVLASHMVFVSLFVPRRSKLIGPYLVCLEKDIIFNHVMEDFYKTINYKKYFNRKIMIYLDLLN